MSGLEKMKAQILEEANHSAQQIIKDAQAQVNKIIKEKQEETITKVTKLVDEIKKEAKNIDERSKSSCEMYKKQALLKAKQEIITDVINKAYEQVINLDTNEYFELMEKLIEKYCLSQDGIICFSQKDLDRLPLNFDLKVMEIAYNKGGTLIIDKTARQIENGFILVYGNIEENCTIRALFNDKNEEISDKLHNLLFL